MKINMEGVKGENDVRGGSRVDAEGLFHVVVTDVDGTQERYEAVIVSMKILAGTDESQVGRTYREFFFLSEGAVQRLKLFGLVTGGARPGQPFEVDDMIGKQAIIEIAKSNYTDREGVDKTSYKTGWDTFYRLDDPKVEHVPRGKSEVESVLSDGNGEDDWDEFE